MVAFNDEGFGGWNPLISTAYQADRQKTLAWLRTQPLSSERDSLLRVGLRSGTPEEKLEIYAALTPAGRDLFAADMVRSSRDDGLELMEPWIKAQPPGAARRAAIRQFASYKAGNAPENIDAVADSWAAGPDREAAMGGIVGALLADSDPIRALGFARRMANSPLRESTFESLASSWLDDDESAARAWIATATELSAEQKRVVLRKFDGR